MSFAGQQPQGGYGYAGGASVYGGGQQYAPPSYGKQEKDALLAGESTGPGQVAAPAKYRDVFWAVLYWLHAAGVVAILVSNALHTRDSGDAATDGEGEVSFHELLRSRLLHVCLACTGLSVVVAGVWFHVMTQYAAQLITLTLYTSLALNGLAAMVFLFAGATGQGVMFLLFFAINALYVYWVRRRIPFASALLSMVCEVIRRFSGTIATSFFMLLCQVVWLVVVGATAVLVYHNHEHDAGKDDAEEQSSAERSTYAFLVFSLFWSSQVLFNVMHVTVAGAFGSWYFLEGRGAVPPNPTLKAFRRASTYSFGSVALGSLFVAIIKFFRAMVRGARNQGRGGLCFCLLDSLLGCIDWAMRYFNRFAFTYVALYGHSYVQAAKACWQLLRQRGFDAIINDDLIAGVLFMGALLCGICVGAVGGVAGYLYLEHADEWKLSALLTFLIGAVLVATAVEAVNAGVAAAFVCLAEDPAALQATSPLHYGAVSDAWMMRWGDIPLHGGRV